MKWATRLPLPTLGASLPRLASPHPRGTWGAFSHSARTAPIITLFIPGTPLQTTPPYRSVHDPFKTASGVQNAGPWDPWLPGVKNGRLFAQRGHSARCAPMGPFPQAVRGSQGPQIR